MNKLPGPGETGCWLFWSLSVADWLDRVSVSVSESAHSLPSTMLPFPLLSTGAYTDSSRRRTYMNENTRKVTDCSNHDMQLKKKKITSERGFFFEKTQKPCVSFHWKGGGSVTDIWGCVDYSRWINAHPRFGAAQVGDQVPQLPPMSGPRPECYLRAC